MLTSLTSKLLRTLNAFKLSAKDSRFDPLNRVHLTEEHSTNFIINIIDKYRELQFRDDNIWKFFKEDFENWIKRIFELADRKAIRILRDFLRTNEVWVDKKQVYSISKALHEVLHEEDEHIWSKEEVEAQKIFENLTPGTDIRQ